MDPRWGGLNKQRWQDDLDTINNHKSEDTIQYTMCSILFLLCNGHMTNTWYYGKRRQYLNAVSAYYQSSVSE
jgi:hypothetical protein